MAYGDTLGALNAALAPLAPASGAATPVGAPQAARGGYGDTLSALSSALGQDAQASGLAAPIPGSAPVMAAGLMPGPAVQAAAVSTASSPASLVIHPAERPPIAPGDLPGDVAQSAASGVEKGAIGMLTLPSTLRSLAGRGENYLIAKIAGLTGQIPEGKTEDDVRAQLNALDDRFTGPSADNLLTPSYDTVKKADEAVAGPLYEPKSPMGDYAQTVGEFVPGASKNLVTGALLPAVASETAGQVTKGTAAEPYARAVGAILGGGVGAAASVGTEAAGKAATVGKQMLQDYRLPAQADGPAIIAGQRLQGAMSDPAKATEALGKDATLVPGSQPTAFQATGDLGLGQLERQLRTTNPEPFIQRDVDQNAARVGSLQAVQPTGSPTDVAARFRAIRDDIDSRAQAAVDTLQPQAQAANDAIGGYGTADAAGSALRGPLADARAAAKDEENQAWGLVNQSAMVPASKMVKTAQDVAGSLSQSAKPMTGEEARIFGVVSGYGDAVPFGELKDISSSIGDEVAAAKLAKNTQTVRRLTMLKGAVEDTLDHGVENQVAQEQVAVRRGTMSPEQTLEAQMRAKWGLDADATRANARAGVARTGTDAGGVAGVGTVEGGGGVRATSATSGGIGQAPGDQGLPPQGGSGPQTVAPNLEARVFHQAVPAEGGHNVVPVDVDKVNTLTGWQPDYQVGPGAKLDRASDFIQGLPEGQDFRPPVLGVHDQGMGFDDGRHRFAAMRDLGFKTAPVSMDPASEAAAHRLGLVNDAPQAIPAANSNAPQTFAQSDVNAYRAAKASTKARASTFDEGPVGDVLAPAARGGYDLSDAAVPSKLVPSGKPTDAEMVRKFIAAGGSTDALADATAQAIRNRANMGDGLLHPGKVMMYLRQNKDALAEMPPEVAAKFKDAATTQATVNDAIARQKGLQDQFNKSALARVAGLNDGSDITSTIGSMMGRNDAVQQIGTLARAAKQDPAAWAGLRRSIVETMFEKSLTPGSAGGMGTQGLKPAVTLRTLAGNLPVLKQVFDDKEIGGMMAVARDLDRANALEPLTKGNRGSSNTAQDSAAKSHDGESIITRAILDAAPAVAGKMVGGLPGAALGWLGAKTIGRGRAAGLEKVDQLVLAGALDPALAKALVAKVPVKPDAGTADALGAQFARISRGAVLGAVNSGHGR